VLFHELRKKLLLYVLHAITHIKVHDFFLSILDVCSHMNFSLAAHIYIMNMCPILHAG